MITGINYERMQKKTTEKHLHFPISKMHKLSEDLRSHLALTPSGESVENKTANFWKVGRNVLVWLRPGEETLATLRFYHFWCQIG